MRCSFGNPLSTTVFSVVLLGGLTPTTLHAASMEEAQRICSTASTTREPVVRVYLDWLAGSEERVFSQFRSNVGDENISLRKPRIIEVTDSSIICRLDVYSYMMAKPFTNLSVRDLDFRFTQSGRVGSWELLSFPLHSFKTYNAEQLADLRSRLYADDTPVMAYGNRNEQQPAPRPRNVLEALSGKQAAYDDQVRRELQEQGIDVDAADRADQEQTKRYAEPCRKNGGTWGWPTDRYGNPGKLGCYFPDGKR